jgi:hypothetical protein
MTKFDYLKDAVDDGRIFSVEFIKRTTGEKRLMVCRLGVKSHLKGGTKKFDDKEKNLLTVFDVQKKGYRSIPLENIISVKIHGEKFE